MAKSARNRSQNSQNSPQKASNNPSDAAETSVKRLEESPPPAEAPTPNQAIKDAVAPPEASRQPASTRIESKNKAEVQSEIAKFGNFKGKFRPQEEAAEASGTPLRNKIANFKYQIHKHQREYRENTVWSTFNSIVRALIKEKGSNILTGGEIFDACKKQDWSHVSRAKYTLTGEPIDAWVVSVIQASTTSKYRVLQRAENSQDVGSTEDSGSGS